MITNEAVDAAAKRFFGSAYHPHATELRDEARGALEAAVPYLVTPDRETILNAMLGYIYEGESIPLIRQGMPQNEWTLLSLAADAVVGLLIGSELDTPSKPQAGS